MIFSAYYVNQNENSTLGDCIIFVFVMFLEDKVEWKNRYKTDKYLQIKDSRANDVLPGVTTLARPVFWKIMEIFKILPETII